MPSCRRARFAAAALRDRSAARNFHVFFLARSGLLPGCPTVMTLDKSLGQVIATGDRLFASYGAQTVW